MAFSRAGYRIASPHPPYTLIAAVGRKLQELPLHRVDPGDVSRNEMIPPPFAGHHLKVTTCVSGGGTCAAEMDKGGEILLLLRVGRHIARSGEDGGDIAVQIYGCQLYGMTRDRANVGTEAAARILDRVRPDAET